MQLLSSKNRPQIIDHLQTNEFDLVVVGGGITGAGIALDAASRGLSVALVEQYDFASGTSSRSTKLIHGGLRYLKQFEISLVREVGRERAIVHRLAPHLVVAEKMLLPLIEGGSYGKWATSFGLAVYDFLADVQGDDRRVMLSREDTLEMEPLLRKDLVVGGGLYAEYRTDDARLTIEIIKTAANHQATSLNYTRAEDLLYNEEGRICGLKCKDLIADREFDIRAKYVVSAAGPWVDKVRKKDNSLKGKHLYPTKGVHIVVPHERFPIRHTVYFDVPDGRMIFAVRRHRVTYIGTTDTPYTGDLNHVVTNQEDVDYLLNGVNNMFPDVNLNTNDVESSWAGLRPLIFEEGKSASELSRKDEIFESDSGLLSIAGGKLTGYRKMAERIVNRVVKKYAKNYDRDFGPSVTEKIYLTGGSFEDSAAVQQYKARLKPRIADKGLSNYYLDYLVHNYGKQTDEILDRMEQFKDSPETALVRAEAWFTVHKELSASLRDFFLRRSGRLYFNRPSIPPTLDQILTDFKSYLGWDEQRAKKEYDQLKQELFEAAHFRYSDSEAP